MPGQGSLQANSAHFVFDTGQFTITKEELREMIQDVIHQELEQYRLKGELRNIIDEYERLTGKRALS